jgi:hypothetical protein
MVQAILAPWLLVLVPVSPVTAALCTYYDQHLHWEQGLDTPDWAAGIATAGNFAYVADGESGLRILDISDPDTPVWAGSLDTPGSAADLALSGSLACVADVSGGLRLIDVSNPSAPAPVGALATPFPVTGVAVAGTHAYVSGGGGGGSGLVVVDISVPSSPSIVTTIAGTAMWRRVAVAGATLYVAAESQGLRIYSLANPASPAFLGATPGFNSASDVAVDGTIAYIRSGSALKSVDVSNPASPTILGELGTGPGTGIAIADGHAFVSTLFDVSGSLLVVDIGDPAALVLTGTITLRDWATDVALSGDRAFVANGTNGVQIIDVSNPTEPPIIGSLSPGENRKVELVGQQACVIDAFSLKLIDVSNPELPVLMGSVSLAGGAAYDLAVSAGRAYVGGESSLRIVDLTNPSSPSLVGSLSLPGSIVGVAVKDGLAFLAESSPTTGKLHVVDVSNPAAPALLASVTTSQPATEVAVAGNLVYLTTSTFFPDNSEFKVFDVSTPASPSLVETLALPGIGVYELAAAGKQAYIVGSFGLIGIDASDPADPVVADSAPTSTLAVQVTVAGAKAYVGCYHTNFTGSYQVVDISNPNDLAIVGNRFTPGTTSGIATDGMHLFLAGDEYGFLVLPAECSTAATVDPAPASPKASLALGPPRPNPIRSGEGTVIAFDLARPMRASLAIYDVTGRQIRLLENRQLAAGANRAWWDGRGDRGEAVAAGIYFCRLETSAGTASRRIVRIH